MAITRTIYTQGKVTLKTGSIGGALANLAIVSGVQNATFSINTPRENVNSFGMKGLVDKVQVAPETATATFSYVLPKNDIEADAFGASANHLSPSKISGLMGDALSDTHSGVHVEVAGIGTLISGVMSSFTLTATAGELATAEVTFDGVPSGGGANQGVDANLPAKASPVTAESYLVLTPDRISGYLPDNSLGSGGDTDDDLIKVAYASDFAVGDDSFTSSSSLTAPETPAGKVGAWLKISNASSATAELSRNSITGTNLDNYIISFRVFNNSGVTVYVNTSLDASGGSSDEFSASAISVANGEDKIVSFSSKVFNTSDILYIKFGANAGNTSGPTGGIDLSSAYIYIKDVVVSTDGGANNVGNFGGCVQSATFSWEVPVERVQCLGETVSRATIFSNPPGTSSLTLEGIDVPYPVSGLILGDLKIALNNARVVSREHNMAVGEVASTYNLTLEATASDALMFKTLTSN